MGRRRKIRAGIGDHEPSRGRCASDRERRLRAIVENMDRSSVRAYLDRPWGLLEEDAERHRAETYRRDPAWAWRTAAALRHAVQKANPRWPTPADREADFAHHLHLCSLLDRASHELARRHRTA
jgi:hypothetical protein